MPDTKIVVTGEPRSEIVRLQIVQLRDHIVHSFITLARLLKEVRDSNYHQGWGFGRWGQWVESGSGLDLSEREAYYLVNIIDRAEQIGIPDEDLSAVKVSSLKQIMSLPADTSPETIKDLVEEAKTLPYRTIKDVVSKLKNEDYVYHTLKFSTDTEENVYQPAMERMRREVGNTIGPDGEPEDITDSRAIELLCADKLAGPDYDADQTIVDAEWEDVVDVPQTHDAANAEASGYPLF